MSSRTDSLKPVTAPKSRASFGAYAVPVVPRHSSSSEPAAQTDQGKGTSGDSVGSPHASSTALRSSGRSSSRAALGLRHSANAHLPPLKARAGPEEAAARGAGSAVRQASQAGPHSSTPEAAQAAPLPTAVETAAALEHGSLQRASLMDSAMRRAQPEPLVAVAGVEPPLPGAVEQEQEPEPVLAGAGGEAAGSEGSTPPALEPEESQPEESEPEDSDEDAEAGDSSKEGGAAPPPGGLMGLIALLEARQAAPPRLQRWQTGSSQRAQALN